MTQKIRLLTLFLQRFEGFSSPRIAVLALNPHAQEFTCGAEKRIARAVRSAQRNARTSLVVEGPFPADTLKQLLTEFDGIVAMYHDQAMIPAKLLATGGVNVTLGLPFPRTSPLHGTAFDIAERYLARPESMIDAIKLCQRMTLMVQ
ncbi:MAG: 4-hydroxythreonine-4-phosphate dehydrogenase PdxA [candidate division WOR-3 bacterium]